MIAHRVVNGRFVDANGHDKFPIYDVNGLVTDKYMVYQASMNTDGVVTGFVAHEIEMPRIA